MTRTINLSVFVVALGAVGGSDSGATLAGDSASASGSCINLRRENWEELAAARLGTVGCLRGPLYVGSHGVFFRVSYAWGHPPYGALISVDIAKTDPRLSEIEAGEIVALAGLIIGDEFCKAQPSFAGCENTDATFFKYHLQSARLVDRRRKANDGR